MAGLEITQKDWADRYQLVSQGNRDMEKRKVFICDHDNPITFPYDGARTERIEELADHCVERWPNR